MIKKIVCTAVLFIAAVAVIADASAQSEWKLKKKGNGIEVYVRDVPGSRLQEFKGTMYLEKTRLSSLMAAFEDTSSYTAWMYECIDAKLLKQINFYERIHHLVTHAPWPVWNRDLVSYSVCRQDPKTLAITISLTGKPDFIPPLPNTVRIPKMTGTWTFSPAGGGDIMVTYQMHNEPGGSIPAGIANMASVDLPYNTLMRLRELIKQEKYA
ncbi:MAG TPA: START domain-containing protein, partial [Spirochaetota bacterium]|nr:START domain-containing protein [Spirochaetota bacterium]